MNSNWKSYKINSKKQTFSFKIKRNSTQNLKEIWLHIYKNYNQTKNSIYSTRLHNSKILSKPAKTKEKKIIFKKFMN